MKLYKEHYLITLILMIIIALNEVQGQQFLKHEDSLNFAMKFVERANTPVNHFRKHFIINEYFNTHFPVQQDADSSTIFPKIIKKRTHTQAFSSRTAKSYNSEAAKTTTSSSDGTKTFNPPLSRSVPIQKIYCHEIRKSELNAQGDDMASVQHICAPLTSNTTAKSDQPLEFSTPTPLYVQAGKKFSNILTSTPKGINCRRVMNSELNELGEIVDTVTEVCDPPTTTTTTTRKPIIHTTSSIVRKATNTAKVLVKVCSPVMDSYLNEEGKIIDSVALFCKMVEAN